MNTLIVTAGHNYEYPALAARLTAWVNHVAAMYGSVPALDISTSVPWAEAKPPHFGRAWIWDCVPEDIDRAIWIDCDAVVIRPVFEDDIPTCEFGAVFDQGRDVAAKLARTPELAGFSPQTFFNSGVMVCRRSTRHVLDALKKHAGTKLGAWNDQGWLNVLVKERLGSWTPLDTSWNAMVGFTPTSNARIIHLAGHAWRGAMVNAIYEAMWSTMYLGG